MTTDITRVGTAGWAVPAKNRDQFSAADSALARYASRLNVVEINSSFYRPHRAATYERWAQSVPESFRFSVKCPKAITHEAKLCDANDELKAFFDQVAGLGPKLGAILVQLAPKLEFSEATASTFFTSMRALYDQPIVIEPRHGSWFEPMADQLLVNCGIARAAADPARVPAAAIPGGSHSMRYYRLHGSPRTYFSAYSDEYLDQLAASVGAVNGETWCIFDNTGGGAAIDNALYLSEHIK